MSKIIKMTQECIDELKDEFSHALESAKLSDGKFTFTKNIGEVERKADLYFMEAAYIKMMALIQQSDKEIAWHGLAKRGDNPDADEYIIYDIMVYPQEVTGATVNTDQEKYQTWLFDHDDEVFNNIRMQGHSHVNMSVGPSSVDTSLYERILEQLEDDMFYIFLIYNKRGDQTIKIYDLAKNVLFETKDVTVYTLNDGTGLVDFLTEAEAMVQDKPITPPAKKTETPDTAGKTDKNASTKKRKKKADSRDGYGYGYNPYGDYDYDGYYGYGGYGNGWNKKGNK